MKRYRVIKLKEFSEDVNKLFSKNEKLQLDKIYDELSERGNR